METPKAEAYQDHPRWVVEYPPRWCQLSPNGLVPPLGLAGVWGT